MHTHAIEDCVKGVLSLYLKQVSSPPSTDALISMCQVRDPRLQRLKRKVLAPIAKQVLADLAELETSVGERGSDFEGIDPSTLMTVSETQSNQMNSSTVGLWGIPSANMQQTPSKKTAKDDLKGKEDEKSTQKRKKRKGESITRTSSNVTLMDLGGIDAIISQILELLAMPLSHPEVYMQLGSDIPRGILLHGPPGCGKTMLANAIANELGIAFISVSAPSVVSGMSGESEKKLRDIFEEAKQVAPCLLFIDEIDVITPKRETVQREMERRIVAQLLTCMDDISLDKTGGKPVMVIGATNRPDALDPALRRGGRFDHEICMSVPDQESRQKIIETLARKLRLEGNFDFAKLAKMTPGYVGADIGALVSQAGVCAIKRIFKDMHSLPSSTTSLNTNEAFTTSGPDIIHHEALNEAHEDTLEPRDAMQVDEHSSRPHMGPIGQFLAKHPDPLSKEELEPLCITFEDFLAAIPSVQPSSKREGFATMPDVTWDDVGAMGSIREELMYAIVEPIRRPEIYASAGISAPAGVLLWGPPGCGKTLLAKAVANESRANFISVRGPELLNKYVGESERAVRQVFVRAKASVPCVIFFDELDALVPRRDDASSESASRVVNTLLTELDGYSDRNGVFVVAATNRPDMIDAAMLRPGRLDKQLFVELPSAHERAEILRTVSRRAPLSSTVDLDAVAHDERCRNFSGADLSALVREASVLALKTSLKQGDPEGLVQVGTGHFEEAFEKVRPSVSDSERLKYYAMKERMSS